MIHCIYLLYAPDLFCSLSCSLLLRLQNERPICLGETAFITVA